MEDISLDDIKQSQEELLKASQEHFEKFENWVDKQLEDFTGKSEKGE